MWIVSSEGRGYEYASPSKEKCKEIVKLLKKDDKEHGGGVDTYYIDEDNTGFFKEGWQ